jgi:hypothetical protein
MITEMKSFVFVTLSLHSRYLRCDRFKTEALDNTTISLDAYKITIIPHLSRLLCPYQPFYSITGLCSNKKRKEGRRAQGGRAEPFGIGALASEDENLVAAEMLSGG